jgi:hypothetical protein
MHNNPFYLKIEYIIIIQQKSKQSLFSRTACCKIIAEMGLEPMTSWLCLNPHVTLNNMTVPAARTTGA